MTMRAPHLLLFGLIAFAPQLASADKQAAKKKQAKAHLAKAMKAHAKDNFPVALKELQAAYGLDPEPDLLYAIGQVYVKLDKCPDAIKSYEAYLATKPAPQATADTEQAIKTCNAKSEPPPEPPPVAAEPPPPAPPPPPEPPPPPVVTPPPPVVATAPPAAPPTSTVVVVTPPERTSPWYTDKVGDALVGGGAAAGVVGLILYRSATSALDDAEASKSIDSYRSLVDDAKSKRTYSVVFLVGGGALIGAGIARYVMHGHKARHETQLGMVPDRGGGLVTWSGGF
jgi:tetratricopeptide (TPR) repeat protein